MHNSNLLKAIALNDVHSIKTALRPSSNIWINKNGICIEQGTGMEIKESELSEYIRNNNLPPQIVLPYKKIDNG